MSKLFLITAIFLVVGCSKKNVSEKYELPEGLTDCTVYYMTGENARSLTVVRCPNSSTTTRYSFKSGKSTVTHNNVVVE